MRWVKEEHPFVVEKWENQQLMFFRPTNFQESNIYSGPRIRRQDPIIGKEQRKGKGGQKQSKNYFQRTIWKQLTVFPKEKAIFSFSFPSP